MRRRDSVRQRREGLPVACPVLLFSLWIYERWNVGRVGNREPVDWVFGYNLWFQTSCCGQALWTYDYSHLTFLDSYVRAEHRVGLAEAKALEKDIRNSTLASSLPA